ncbi:MAG: hypothetical protein OXG10_06985 [Candidatus Dadabacteria bacterium]|nr:hypothetical protein [Candidatus Dadabacteria bacterium]
MKFKTYGIVLNLLFALGLVFSFSVDASADHDGTGIAAGEVEPTSEEDVKAFLDHIIDYHDQVFSENADDANALPREVVIYNRDIRREGPYKNSQKNMYSMGINERGVVTNHAGYPKLFGYHFDSDAEGSAVASTIQALIDGLSVDAPPHCETYDTQNTQGRVACAKKVKTLGGNVVTTIAGLHHAEDDSAFSVPDCAEFMLDTSAEDVFESQSDASLENYVKGVIGVFQRRMADITAEVFSDSDPAKQEEIRLKIGARVFDKIACFGSGDFEHENIYVFVMDANLEASTVLFNGNNFDLNGASLELNDDSLPGDDKSIARLFNRELGEGTSTYVNYRWDDPTTEADDIEGWFEMDSVPGTSCKRSYIELADLNALTAEAVTKATGLPFPSPERPYIFGSGTYPGEGPCSDDDDGCAIAGTGHTSQSALLNMFLIASVLFSAVFLRRRA